VEGARGEKIVAARVSLVGTAHSASVDENGGFRFAGLPTGTQGFEVLALGYLPRRFRAEVTRETRVGVIKLDKAVVVLDSIRIVARRRHDTRAYPEFEERLRRRGFGRFITEEMIEQKHPFVLSDMLRVMPGIFMTIGVDRRPIPTSNRGVSTLLNQLNPKDLPHGSQVMGSLGSGGSCYAVYVDGVLEADDDFDRVVPYAVHGVEIYRRNEAPAKYSSGRCGVVLIWSK
jgi:hypothetical protein